MRGMRNTGGVVSLALLASLVGHYAIHRHFERRSQVQLSHANFKQVADFDADSNSDDEFEPPQPDVLRLHQPEALKEQILREVVAALNEQDAIVLPPVLQVGDSPSQVPSPAESLPDDIPETVGPAPDAGEAAAVRGVIEQELSHATREEREIWFDELKTLPAGVVRDLLQVRKQLRALPKLMGGMPEKLASVELDDVPTRSREIAAEPASTRIRFNTPDQMASVTALEVMISQLRHNVTNAATPGFKRLRVTLVDVYGSQSGHSPASGEPAALQPLEASIQGDGCRMGPVLVDQTQGPLRKTGRPLDLAISGEGFYVLKSADRTYVTRCGAFTLNRSRQLCLATTNEELLLQPVVSIPDGAQEIRVSAEGAISVTKFGDTSRSTVIGTVSLGHVASPTRLQPVGSSLFAISEGSGPIVLDVPGVHGQAELHQGFLEQANVDLEKEQDEIEELTTILKSFPSQNLRPATASHSQESPNR